jgi:hypothetical protein
MHVNMLVLILAELLLGKKAILKSKHQLKPLMLIINIASSSISLMVLAMDLENWLSKKLKLLNQ